MEGLYHIDMNRTASSKMKAYFIYVVDEDVYLNVDSDWEEVIFVFLIFEECHSTQVYFFTLGPKSPGPLTDP